MRDYDADMAVCVVGNIGPCKVQYHEFGCTVTARGLQIATVDQVTNRVELLSGNDADYIATACTALPWYIRRVQEMEAWQRRAVNVLEKLERIKDEYGNRFCRSCDARINNDVTQGHAPDCALAALIREARGS